MGRVNKVDHNYSTSDTELAVFLVACGAELIGADNVPTNGRKNINLKLTPEQREKISSFNDGSAQVNVLAYNRARNRVLDKVKGGM